MCSCFFVSVVIAFHLPIRLGSLMRTHSAFVVLDRLRSDLIVVTWCGMMRWMMCGCLKAPRTSLIYA